VFDGIHVRAGRVDDKDVTRRVDKGLFGSGCGAASAAGRTAAPTQVHIVGIGLSSAGVILDGVQVVRARRVDDIKIPPGVHGGVERLPSPAQVYVIRIALTSAGVVLNRVQVVRARGVDEIKISAGVDGGVERQASPAQV